MFQLHQLRNEISAMNMKNPGLFETIKCKDGEFFNLAFHQKRFDLARKNYFGTEEELLLNDFLKVPEECQNGLFRCRVIYRENIENIEFIPYHPREIHSLKLVFDNEIDYSYKFTDRNKLTSLFEQREDCDDILIIKNGFVTDSYAANPIFFDGTTWWTTDTPLLPGTQRARLLSEPKIKICKITANDLSKYKMIGLINAMLDLNDMPIISIENIKH